MSNIPKPHDLEDLMNHYSKQLDGYGRRFNSNFSKLSLDLKGELEVLKERIEKYASFSRESQLEHLADQDHVHQELGDVHDAFTQIKSKIDQLEKLDRFGHHQD